MQDVQTQVQLVAGQIVTKMQKLGAMTEASLLGAIGTVVQNIPAPDTTAPIRQTRMVTVDRAVRKTTLELMVKTGQLRRVRTTFNKQSYGEATYAVGQPTTITKVSGGMTYQVQRTAEITETAELIRKAQRSELNLIASPTATTAELVEATKRHFATQRKTKNAAKTLSNFDIELTQKPHNSETEDGCLAIQSVTDALTAEETNWETAEQQRLYNAAAIVGVYAAPRPTPLSPEAKAKVAYQDRIGQGPRNTKRAEARRKQDFLNSPEGQAWLEEKAAEDDAAMASALARPTVERTHQLPEQDEDVFSIAFE